MQRRTWLVYLSTGGLTGSQASDLPAGGSGPARTLRWPELMPPGWNPLQLAASAPNLALLSDSSPRAQQLLRELRQAWDDAPTRPELDGQRVRLPGYVVPLERSHGVMHELLLVPYFGACIHSPPPPANQVIHVVLAKPRWMRSMDTVWVSGTLRVQRTGTTQGTSAYAIADGLAEPYQPPEALR